MTINDRPKDLLSIRPEIKKTITFDSMNSDERFQNETLRPILKLQNPLLISVFTNYIKKRKGVFYDLSLEKKITYIENSLIKDQKFRSFLKGLIIGHFTVAEYQKYSLNSSSLNKRIINMLIKRLQHQVKVFDLPLSVS